MKWENIPMMFYLIQTWSFPILSSVVVLYFLFSGSMRDSGDCIMFPWIVCRLVVCVISTVICLHYLWCFETGSEDVIDLIASSGLFKNGARITKSKIDLKDYYKAAA